MRRLVGGLATMVGLFMLACAPAPAAPAAQPAQPAAAPAAAPAAPAARPAPAAQPAKPAAPAAQPAAAAKRQLAPGFEVDQALLDAAKKEGKVVFWGALTEQDNKLVGAKFEELTGIAVETVRLSAGPQFTRITKEREAKLYTVDVISHGDVGLWQIHKQKKNIVPYTPDGAKKYAPEFRDKDGAYFPIWVLPMVIGYNSKLITGADIPKRYADLADPKYKGKVATAHPKHSGTGNELVIILTNTLGWGYYEKLKQNELFIVRSQLELNPIAATGERPLSIGAVDSAFLADKQAGKPLELVYPDDGAAVALSVSGVVNDAPHPNAAKLFQEWLHSQAGQTLLASRMYMVPHPDAVYPAGRTTLKEIKTIALSADEVEKKSQATRERFSDLFGG